MSSSYSQPNIALAAVRAILKQQGGRMSARSIAEAIAAEFPDVPVALLRLIAGRLLAVFYDPIMPDDLARLNQVEQQDVSEFLADIYSRKADALRAAPTPQ